MRNEHESTYLGEAEQLRDKAVRLFTYLEQVCRLRFVKVLDCRNYEKVLWFSDIPQEPECSCVAWPGQSDQTDSWIEIRRSAEPPCPAAPQVCRDWVSDHELADSSQPPTLRQEILITVREEEAPVRVQLGQKPGVQAAWREFLAKRWEPWAQQHRRWKSVQQVYGNLFTLHQRQKRLGETMELRVALGLLSWLTPQGERVYRHILTGQATVNFDATRGLISVSPGGDGVKLTIEHDMLQPEALPTSEQHQAIEGGVQANAETPWDKVLIEPLLRAWIHGMNERGSYSDSLQAPSAVATNPQITFAPALILRRRSGKSLVKLLGDIAKNLKTDGDIPFGVQRLCRVVEDVAPDQEEDGAPGSPGQLGDAETYFPLPANEEQSKIARRLNSGRGILVQGPPGTGKSHTIANLICHLLAKGKRVLVTSQTPHALKVLQEKIPPQLSALCVSVLGNDTDALKNMENSVLGITERHHDWDAGGRDQNATAVRRLEEEIYADRKRFAEIESILQQSRSAETYRHSVAGGAYDGTAASIAQRVTAESANLGWLPDAVALSQEMPLQPKSFAILLQLLRSLTSTRCQELNRPFAAISELPDVDRFLRLAEAERTAREICQTQASRHSSSALKALVQCAPTARGNALEKLQALQTAVGNIRRRPLKWISNAIAGVLSDQDRPWSELLDATTRALAGLRERARSAHGRKVQLPEGIDRQRLLADALDLHAHLASGGNYGFAVFRPSVVRRTLYVSRQVRVNGRACDSVPVLAELIEHLDLEARVETLWDHWVDIAKRVPGPLPRQVTELEECQEALGLVVGLIPFLDEAKAALQELRGITEPAWHDASAVADLIADLEAVAAQDALNECAAQLSPVLQVLACAEVQPNAHPVNAAMAHAVRSRDAKGYSEAWNELRQLTQERQGLNERNSLLECLKGTAPKLASNLLENPASPLWDERLPSIEQAWNWARANAWLQEYHRNRDVESLEAEIRRLQENLQSNMSELAAQKAWRHCFDHLTENQRQNLMAWTLEIKRIGRGTGARAEIHRRNARKHMSECRNAVPAWIMPFYRLAETIEARPEVFDIVIVDEASQSGPDTLALLYFAKQIIIVGDNQQISPEAIGTLRANVDLLSERLLADFPLRNVLDVESSLFDQAVVRFGRRIVLREHFRCVPEIIRFSNDLCYAATPLIPLRQYPPERLQPIIVRHVPDGFREGSGGFVRNKPEAEALADVIAQCAGDPRYRCDTDKQHPYGKLTFGVISLQGEGQAKLISQLLLERLTPEEIEQRDLVCGDAYAFQGDERDVIFLSLVTAPNERFAALTKETDKQRFNVAASRARDQVWLFHTATLNELNPNDMRYKLLDYYSNPGAQAVGKPNWDKCDSEFEREVGQMIHARGYRVMPQYEPFGPGAFRIDFVVEGLQSRLAVECDGPYHDDVDQIKRDMARQRQLERCKWVFWRVSASVFYLDREKALAPLWRKLDSMKILPWPEAPPQPPAPVVAVPPSTPPRRVQVEKDAAFAAPAQSPPVRPSESKLAAPAHEPLPSAVAAPEPAEQRAPADSVSSVRIPPTPPAAPTPEELLSCLRRSKPSGFFDRDDLRQAILLLLHCNNGSRKERKELVLGVIRGLSLPESDAKRIDNALRALDDSGRISLGEKFVSLVS